MKKLTCILFSIIFTFALNEFANAQTNSNTSTGKSNKNKTSRKKSKKQSESVCGYHRGVANLNLSQIVINLSCSPTDAFCESNRIIEVATVTVEFEEMKYIYTVSAGKIIGEGANIKWDLYDVKPGVYTITAGISEPIWGVLGQTQTKTLTIKE